MYRIGSAVLAVLVVCALALAGGALYEQLAARGDAARFPPPGQRVDVGGHALHIDCRGEGSPTVVPAAGACTLKSFRARLWSRFPRMGDGGSLAARRTARCMAMSRGRWVDGRICQCRPMFGAMITRLPSYSRPTPLTWPS